MPLDPFDPNDRSGPKPVDRDMISFRTDLSGRPIAIRPHEFLANADGADDRFREVVGKAIEEVTGRPDGAVEPNGVVRGGWRLYQAPGDVDVLRLVRAIRSRGIPAQANHVYFFSAMAAPGPMHSSVWNTFAANIYTPNMFTPNMFTPNMFTAGGGGPGGGCCSCPHGPVESEEEPTPQLTARPDQVAPADQFPQAQHVDIHIIDVASPIANGLNRTGSFKAGVVPADPGDGLDEHEDGWVDPATGHGEFVASVLERQAGVRVTRWQAAGPFGDISDAALIRAMEDVDHAADATRWRILNLSLSGYNEDDRANEALVGQVKSMQDAGWLIVASAGNFGSCRLAWPAALPGVVAVGAIRKCVPAWFSNYGPWVDVSAPGVDIVAAYPDLSGIGNDSKGAPTRTLKVGRDRDANGNEIMLVAEDFNTGQAKWSGTSFSAPFVAGRLARLLETGGEVPGNDPATQIRQISAALKALLHDDLDWLPYYGRILPA